MRMLKRRKRRVNGPRVRHFGSDTTFENVFGDEYELGDDVADEVIGGAPNDTQK